MVRVNLTWGSIWYPIFHNLPITAQLGWEIWSEFRRIPQLSRFRTFSLPEFSSEFHISTHKICSRKFRTHSCQFKKLSRNRCFQFHASENFPAIFLFCPPKLHLLIFQVKPVDVILGWKIMWVFSLKSYLVQVCKPCHHALVEAIEPFKLHPMSMSYIYEMLECLLRLWMGKWLPIHILTTTDTSQDL
jgi:hypothetical protein